MPVSVPGWGGGCGDATATVLARRRSPEAGGDGRPSAAGAVRVAGARVGPAVFRGVAHGPGLRPVRRGRRAGKVTPRRRAGKPDVVLLCVSQFTPQFSLCVPSSRHSSPCVSPVHATVLPVCPQFTLGVAEEQQDMIPRSSKPPRQRRCGHCLLQQPMRSKHCQTCQHCVRRYDHHCPWIENCVGERNHRWFVMYLAVQLIVLLWGLHMAWSGFAYASTWQLWLRTNGVLLGATLVLGLLCLTVLLLLGSHLYLVSLNTTTWEFMSRHRISYLKHCGMDENPFDRGTLRNLWDFFCVWGTVVWEQVYFRESSDPI
ncbi:palmitoyltransferase ZDHHC12-B isoform X1 [Denticeps clupeoides]|uniref:palmitoyltransferase ZDHHC12-B isoform X1 n=1 Tax=Denticeps clupeoides TaxID=299321 RepID=UPI0010A2BDDF|nr:probable palmitoyltransferase ZDHHC12 isoform X1 [Denticeps clupeoides]